MNATPCRVLLLYALALATACNCTLIATSASGLVLTPIEPEVSLCTDESLKHCLVAVSGDDLSMVSDGTWQFDLGQEIYAGGDQERGCTPKNVLSVRAPGCDHVVLVLEERTHNALQEPVILNCNRGL